MTTVKLLNQGQRVIQLEGGDFGPKQVVAVNKELADKLLLMYEGEVVDLASYTKDMSEKAKVMADQEPTAGFTEVKLDKSVEETEAHKKGK